MKRKNILVGAVGLAAIATFLVTDPFNFRAGDGQYNQEDLSVFEKQSADDAQKWLAARYIDLETGKKITPEKLQAIIESEKNRTRAAVVFEELGPDNIGGRTRGIQPDRQDPNKVWAGGVSGGLFYSTDGANSWTRLDEFPGLPYISSITQTPDLTVWVATGTTAEEWGGDGLYYKTANSSTWLRVEGSQNFAAINQVCSSDANDWVYMSTSGGLKRYKLGDTNISDLPLAASGASQACEVSLDGQVIVAHEGSRVYVSEDGGTNFNNVTGTAAGQIPSSGTFRYEFAISPKLNAQGKYNIYCARTNGNLQGMDISQNSGATWNQFIGSADASSSLNIYNGQGTYNSILSVDPRNEERLLIGGIDIWEWEKTADNPPAGGFDHLSLWSLHPSSDKYVHADNHEMKWDKNNRFYMGNDGGVGISEDFASTFYPANRGYNVTQFYGMAMDRNGAVMAGAQDNGTLYNDFTMFYPKNFREVGGGDGFECEISFYNPDVLFASVYNNQISRSFDRGYSFSSFIPDFPGTYGPVGLGGGSEHPFHTELMLAEYYDPNSEDSVLFMPKQNYDQGDKIKVASMATGDSILVTVPKDLYYQDTVYADASLTRTDYIVYDNINGSNIDLGQTTYTITFNASGSGTVPEIGDTITLDNGTKIAVADVSSYTHYFASSPDPTSNAIFDLGKESTGFNISWDTLHVADPYQSWFFVFTNANGGEIWGTRDATRFSTDPTWIQVATGLGTGSMDIEFSKDLNYCYISCGSAVYRIDGLGSLYSQSPTFVTDVQAAGVGKKTVTTTSAEGLALNPSNPNDLIIFQLFSGTMRRSNNATSANPSFTAVPTPLPMACYDGIIDREDPKIIIVGTALGVRTSTDGGNTWENSSAGFDNVPVFEVRQNWRTWDEGCYRPGEVYLCTYGRGIWATTDFLNVPGQENLYADKLKTNLNVYPNPVSDGSVLAFDLQDQTNVKVNVYSITGKLVRTYEIKNASPGKQTINLETSDLNSGTYIVKYQAGKIEESVKFIKM